MENNQKDAELDNLLDDALDDFKVSESSQNATSPLSCQSAPHETDEPGGSSSCLTEPKDVSSPANSEPYAGVESASGAANRQDAFGDAINALLGGGAQTQFADLMKAAFGEDEDTLKSFEKMWGESVPEFCPGEIEHTLQEAMNAMKCNAGEIQELSEDPDLEKLIKEFGDFGMTAPEGADAMAEGDNMIPAMQNVMDMLLSKDVFFPAVQEMANRFPTWITEHEVSLSESDVSRYRHQLEYMKQICSEYESETPNDSSQLRSARTLRISQILGEMQPLGFPPEDIAGKLPFQGNPTLTPDQCNVM